MAPSVAARVRSLGGCFTCRKRHVKCDERRPECGMCEQHGLKCGGYKARIAFDVDDADPDTLRRPLYTPSEQQSLSESLAGSISQKLIHRKLLQLDEVKLDEGDVHVGPFGVFSSAQVEKCHDPATISSSSGDGSTIEVLDEHSLLDFGDEVSAFGFQELFPDMFHGSLDDMPPLPGLSPRLAGSGGSDNNHEYTTDQLMLLERAPTPWRSASPSLCANPSKTNAIPPDAVFLLANCGETVVGYLAPLHRQKTLWHVLHLPIAKLSLAGLALNEDPGHARLVTFYSMLAISAYCLGGESSGKLREFWASKGTQLKLQAQRHLSCTLQQLPERPKRAKYKETLMALLTMVITKLYAGDTEHAPLYLHDADSLIRLIGVRKQRKSRKVRMLHHHYTYLRLFHESTNLYAPNTTRVSHGHEHASTGGEDSFTVEARRDRPFRLAKWKMPLDQEMLRVQTRERGENDINLQEPGCFCDTMYPKIVGVPESWLFLLSQTIRLGNERDIADQTDDINALSWQEFSSRAQALEKCISSWQPPNFREHSELIKYVDDSIDEDREKTLQLLENMLSALHHALRVYFYRRIYNVDAVILQQQVASIRACLEGVAGSTDSRLKYSAGFLWPAFLGACEALDSGNQAFYSDWFTSLTAAGFVTALASMSIIQHVWQLRSETGDNTTSWCDYLRHSRVQLVFF